MKGGGGVSSRFLRHLTFNFAVVLSGSSIELLADLVLPCLGAYGPDSGIPEGSRCAVSLVRGAAALPRATSTQT